MKKQHKYPTIEQIRESLQNLPPESKAQSTKKFLEQQEDLKMPPNKLGYDDNVDGDMDDLSDLSVDRLEEFEEDGEEDE